MNAEAIRSWLTARLDDDERLIDEYETYMAERAAAAGSYVLAQPPGWRSGEPFDVDRIRREIAAKRRRLQRHAPGSVVQDGDETWVRCNGHEWVAWPCPDIIDDAQAWADRDNFPAELRLP